MIVSLVMFVSFIGIIMGDLLVLYLVQPGVEDLEIRMTRLEKRVDL